MSVLNFTPDQFEKVTHALADRTLANDPELEERFNALATNPQFAERFVQMVANAGLDPSNPTVQLNVRAIAISFFIYGEELGRIEQAFPPSPSKFVN